MGKTPGKYTATFTCLDGTKTKPPATTKPSKPKPAKTTSAKPKAPQVEVKPVGAPQTGGGALALG
ncbi:hypothetical protein [Amycolatopsis sp. lyj-112]|uniref:hypothetical protein n=1 Tax=Amycolatopsis sp. lyj-112 TaxID=2789288 RepID=UPI003978E0B9